MFGESRRKRLLFVLAIVTICSFIWLHATSLHDYIPLGVSPNIRGNENLKNTVVKSVIETTNEFTPRSKYDFVTYKRKPGWHFVNYPVHYTCKKDGPPVTVRFTTNASDVFGADAVFFTTGPMELEEWEALHRYRTPGQMWVFATQEPAAIVPDYLPPKVYRYSSYNWSFTFHSTSDIHGAYGWYTPYDKAPANTKQINWFKQRPKFASWVSSRHCLGLGWDRTQFVKDLGNFIPIDMFGECGNLTLRRNTGIAKDIFQFYKFHLSFENSCCSEYLTEKVWNSLQKWESVPIVLGGTKEEYRKLMPPHSYIHADDFESLDEFGNYIKKVGNNETLYNEYFDWREKGTVHQQEFNRRFPVFKDGACKVVKQFESLTTNPVIKSFDPYGPNWFGSCYRCGEHDWIQDYNIWWRRLIFHKEWEANRTLHWLDGDRAEY